MNSDNKQSGALLQVYIPELSRILSSCGDVGNSARQWFEQFKRTEISPSGLLEVVPRSTTCYWCHCVELMPDHAGIQVRRAVRVENQSKKTLLELLNSYFSERGLKFQFIDEQLILTTDKELPLEWKNITELIGENLYFSLGNSKEQTEWLALINEIQMLLARSEAKFSFNGIWISHCPAFIQQSPLQKEHESVVIIKDGLEHWLYSEWDLLADWINQVLTKVKSLMNECNEISVVDGYYQWELKKADNWHQRLKRIFKLD